MAIKKECKGKKLVRKKDGNRFANMNKIGLCECECARNNELLVSFVRFEK